MKKILLLIASILLFATSCEKLGIEKGKYSASVTGNGMLNIELLSDEKCILYFTGGPETSGYYHIDGDQITIIGHANTTESISDRDYESYRFSSDNPGTIYSETSFGIYVESLLEEETHYLSFTKR